MNTTISAPKKTNVEVKVLAINTLYKYAAIILKHEQEHFNKFLGIDIFKVDGSIKMKYEHEKLSFKGQFEDKTCYDVHYWYTKRSSIFDITVKVCVNGGSYDVRPSTAFCQYEEMTFTLYDLENNNLKECTNNRNYLSDEFNVDELTAIANDIKQAAKVYEQALNKMPYIFKEVFSIQGLRR
jgi:hypothetical protein